MKAYKQPESALVVIYRRDGQFLLLERAAHPGYWQSVTGSREGSEALIDTARRELREETGLDWREGDFRDLGQTQRYEIFAEWRHRYAPGVTHNTEHLFSFCLPAPLPVRLSPDEHRQYQWLPGREAAAKCFSWSNRDAILALSDGAAAR